MSKLFRVILCLGIYPCWGQTDTITIFYDKDWHKVASLSSASFYGKIYENEIGHWTATDYYLNGKIQMTGIYLDSTLQIKQGNFVWFYENGQKKTVASYWNNYLIDEYYEYYDNGQVDTHQLYDNFGQLKDSKFYKEDGSNSIMEEALFQGKDPMLSGNFLANNINYPKYARKRNIQGKVIIRFEINEKGIIQKPKILSSPDASLSKEALRVIMLMTDWTPAKRDGQAVTMALNIPINFTLD
jgi:periplasmic protein TonB